MELVRGKPAVTNGFDTAWSAAVKPNGLEIPEDWAEAIKKMPPETARMMDFLLTNLPASDIINYPAELFASFVEHAMFLRENLSWCAWLPTEAFKHYVLFPRVNDEDLSFYGKFFYDLIMPRIEGITDDAERVLAVNRWCSEYASYEQQDDRTVSAMTVFRCGSGRCGEESVFLVSALRSVGIAARQVYVPRWSHCDDNHAWVEAFCNGEWHFLGACEPEPIIDRGWFNASASRAILVHSRLFGPNGTRSYLDKTQSRETGDFDKAASSNPAMHGEYIGRSGVVSFYAQTPRYAEVSRRVFRAFKDGKPARGTRFHIQILNESSFHTVAVLTAGSDGCASMELGKGSIHCLAELDGYYAEADIDDTEYDFQLVSYAGSRNLTRWKEFTFIAPPVSEKAQKPLNAEQQCERERTLERVNAIREARISGFMPDLTDCPLINTPRCIKLLEEARGNAAVVLRFLRGAEQAEDAEDDLSKRLRFLEVLPKKDLRDTGFDVFDMFYTKRPNHRDGVPDDVYWNYVASPRIANEKLTAWREQLMSAPELMGERSRWNADLSKISGFWDAPLDLWYEINRRFKTLTVGNYANLYFTPGNALRAGCCDEKSKVLLFIAVLRTLGVPARFRRDGRQPEIFVGGRFVPVSAEFSGRLIIYRDKAFPEYAQNWSMSRRGIDGWSLMDPSGIVRRDDGISWVLPEGDYRIITSVRLPNGNQFAVRNDFEIVSRRAKRLKLKTREYELSDMLRVQELPDLQAWTPEGEAVENIFNINGRPSVLIWLDQGSEPSEHVLNEMPEKRSMVEKPFLNIIFLVREEQRAAKPTLARALNELRGTNLFIDNWAYDMETIARCMSCDPDTPPLIVICDKDGRAVYGTSGYKVGSVELCMRVAAHLADPLSPSERGTSE